jgi:hypothetical protein
MMAPALAFWTCEDQSSACVSIGAELCAGDSVDCSITADAQVVAAFFGGGRHHVEAALARSPVDIHAGDRFFGVLMAEYYR